MKPEENEIKLTARQVVTLRMKLYAKLSKKGDIKGMQRQVKYLVDLIDKKKL